MKYWREWIIKDLVWISFSWEGSYGKRIRIDE